MPSMTARRSAFYVFLLLAVIYLSSISFAVSTSHKIRSDSACCLNISNQLIGGACFAHSKFIDRLYKPNSGWVNALLVTCLVLYLIGCAVIAFNWVIPHTRAAPANRIKSTWVIGFFGIIWVLTLYASAAGFAAFQTHDVNYQHCFSGNVTTPPLLAFMCAVCMGLCLLYMMDRKNSLRRSFFSYVSFKPTTRPPDYQPTGQIETSAMVLEDEDDTVFE